ncbi:MAG: preprotein translocase subunit SecA [Candidatus Zixiibacteriota bacterium]
MLGKLLEKVFGTSSERACKKLWPIVEEINKKAEEFEKTLTDDELKNKTNEFKEYINEKAEPARSQIRELEEELKTIEDPEQYTAYLNRLDELGEEEYALEQDALDDIMVEAFAVVKDTCRRLVGQEFTLTGHKSVWDMVPYDVQLLGAIVLHHGNIAEMKTGEGKTLVSTMPLYLNALVGKGAHLVTVNDYLARRDAQWNGQIYEFLGLSVGCIDDSINPHSKERREQYHRDITYGTNNQFGFDYLRDNMSTKAEDRVQRDYYYCIIDEVDSVLIDEARTPLIISGPVESKIHEKYRQWVSHVSDLVRKQAALSNRLLREAKEDLENDREEEASIKLLMVQRSTPKNKQFMKLTKEPGIQKLINTAEANMMRDKRMHEIDDRLYFAKDEKGGSLNLQDMGLEEIAPDNPETFVLPELGYELDKIDRDPDLSEEEKAKKKQKLYTEYAERSEDIHAINQLLKAYALFEKDNEYVVTGGKVVIVDEFTGRLMPGRRFSDGLHMALEAKENVKVERETQTFATITIQNFFRLYHKLSGMTGTAITESEEFYEIYKLDVIEIPTNKPVIRKDHEDVVYMTRREKYNAILDEIERAHANHRPILVGTTSVDVSETLSRMLKRRGISHAVLNAKQHEKEAEIVADAGRGGAVTIATNMAGRGTDIKLGEGVVEAGGLYIIGSERHESRRIDNQLRGRAGRQGDPGSSRFFVSLEDDLMRLHAGGDRIASVMEKVGTPKNEPMTHPMVSSSIERAQKRVEAQNFAIRKHLLEYDDVMNQQRTVIYSKRNEILDSENLIPKYREYVEDFVESLIEIHTDLKSPPDTWDWDAMKAEFSRVFLLQLDLNESEDTDLHQTLLERGWSAFKLKSDILGEIITRDLMRWAMLTTIDNKWKEHLHAMDTLKEGINLRSYAQKDPLIEYKKEGFDAFVEMLDEITKDTLVRFFHTQVRIPENMMDTTNLKTRHESVQSFDEKQMAAASIRAEKPSPQSAGRGAPQKKTAPIKKEGPKVGRNDPCPCGSGKKYKHCCGRK